MKSLLWRVLLIITIFSVLEKVSTKDFREQNFNTNLEKILIQVLKNDFNSQRGYAERNKLFVSLYEPEKKHNS
jgi:hypothetical protein